MISADRPFVLLDDARAAEAALGETIGGPLGLDSVMSAFGIRTRSPPATASASARTIRTGACLRASGSERTWRYIPPPIA